MAKMKLNIKTFDMEGAFVPDKYNSLISVYDEHIPEVNNSFVRNQDALQVFRNVAGSPRLSSLTQELVNGLNNSIDATANYFDSVKNWTASVVDAVQNVLSVGLPQAGNSVDRTVLDQISENFQEGAVGIQNFKDAEEYIASIQEVISQLRNGLNTITSDVEEADASLPAEVHSALGTTIATNNDDVLSGYDRISQYMVQNVEDFSSQLQNAINDMAAGARGGN